MDYTEWATKKYPAFRLHLFFTIVLISVFMLCYGPGLLFRDPSAGLATKINRVAKCKCKPNEGYFFVANPVLHHLIRIRKQRKDTQNPRHVSLIRLVSKESKFNMFTCVKLEFHVSNVLVEKSVPNSQLRNISAF
jgi:hypothetical protein